jgi:hypothetical protein
MSGESADDPSGEFGRNLADGVGDDFGDVFNDAAPQQESPPQEDDPLTPLVTALAARIAEYRRRRRSLFAWIHPQRLDAFAYAPLLPALDERRAAELAELWLASLGVQPAPLLSFTDPSFPLIELPLTDSLRVLRMRALLEHVDEVRSWIDRPRRQLLQQWLGPEMARALVARNGALAGVASTGIGGGGGSGGNLPLPAEPSADELAWRGFRLFERDCSWGADHPMQLAQFALPDETALGAPLEPAEREKVSLAGLTLIAQLSDFFAARSC